MAKLGRFPTYKREECEGQADELIDELYVQQNFPRNGMICTPYLFKMHERIDRGKESSVQPSPPLGYELWNSIYIEKVSKQPASKDSSHLPGTSVSPVALLTYFSTHRSSLLATNSQQRIRSSARYMFAVKTSASCPCNVSPLKY